MVTQNKRIVTLEKRMKQYLGGISNLHQVLDMCNGILSDIENTVKFLRGDLNELRQTFDELSKRIKEMNNK